MLKPDHVSPLCRPSVSHLRLTIMPKAETEIVIRTKSQWDAITSPVRAAIIESLEAFGPQSARELATKQRRSQALIHHHLAILLRAKIVTEQGPRDTPRRTEMVFALRGKRILFDFESKPAFASQRFVRLQRLLSRNVERQFARTADPRLGFAPEFVSHATMRSESANLTPREVAAVRKHLAEILDIFVAARSRDSGNAHQILWTFFPSEPQDHHDKAPAPRAVKRDRKRPASG